MITPNETFNIGEQVRARDELAGTFSEARIKSINGWTVSVFVVLKLFRVFLETKLPDQKHSVNILNKRTVFQVCVNWPFRPNRSDPEYNIGTITIGTGVRRCPDEWPILKWLGDIIVHSSRRTSRGHQMVQSNSVLGYNKENVTRNDIVYWVSNLQFVYMQ